MDLYEKMLMGTIKKQIVPTGKVKGRLAPTYDENDSDSDDEVECGTSYAQTHIAREKALYEDAGLRQECGSMSGVDAISSLMEEATRVDIVERVYVDYNFVRTNRPMLPIDARRIDILQSLQIANVVVIQGATGCGKTTQVPQFILNDYQEKKEYCNIIVTQPRKLAAISIANRVCEERGWALGEICGYQVGLDKKVSQDTILKYVTTGVLLQKLITTRNLNEFTHIIIDEVHERTQEMDFLLIILRRFQSTNSQSVKIILMSATFDSSKFTQYFGNTAAGLNIAASLIEIGRQQDFQRTIHYIDELSLLGPLPQNVDSSRIEIPSEVYHIFIELIKSLNFIGPGHVLVFLPGIYEIQHVNMLLRKLEYDGGGNYYVVPLHSSIPANEQRKVFLKPEEGVRKIILSTNIAESSITVPDVVFVIDFCLTKILVVDQLTQHQSLRLTWASKTNCVQRAGRVGRVCDGRVYRMITQDFYEDGLAEEIEPELLRAPLDRMVLYTKKIDFTELPEAILALAIDPPNLENIAVTIKNLKLVGALLTTCRGQFIASDGDLTPLGDIMCSLPMDTRLAKLVCLGYIFSCLEEAIIMACGCALSNIFFTPFHGGVKCYTNKLVWADGSCSDLLTYLNLYTIYERNKRSGAFPHPRDERNWCENNYLSHRAMTEWGILIEEVKLRLRDMNITKERGPCFIKLEDNEKALILKVIIAGAFYPNYYTRSCDAGQVDEKEIFRTLRGLNPHHTVYFTNMDRDQPGPLYEERIKQMMSPISDDVSVYFDNTSKVYVMFNDKREHYKKVNETRTLIATMPGGIGLDVYKAVHLRHLRRFNTSFRAMLPSKAWELAVQFGIATNVGGYDSLIKHPRGSNAIKRIIPSIYEKTIHLKIIKVIEAAHFYAHRLDSAHHVTLRKISEAINNPEVIYQPIKPHEIDFGGMYICKYAADNKYYRCQVFGINRIAKNDFRIQINCIDYGKKETVAANTLFRLPPGEAQVLPPQALECVLSEVEPSVMRNPRGLWSEESRAFFEHQVSSSEMIGKIYSTVDDVVYLELFKMNSDESVNELMVKSKFGQRREESYISKENHETRRLCADQMPPDDPTTHELNTNEPALPFKHVDAPSERDCRVEINLRGPYSPLEMKVYSIGNVQYNVRIASTSVNSVLLDTDPQDPHEKLLVAAYALKGQEQHSLTLKRTTIMPNIHGLTALMALIFCPVMKMKASADGSEFVSILCGLGADNRGKAIYASQDLKITLDVEISLDDLTLVNDIRYNMNKLLDIMKMHMENIEVPPNYYHRYVKDSLKKLLEAQRETKERKFVSLSDNWARSVFEGDKLAPKNEHNMQQECVWPLHQAIALKITDKARLSVEKNLQDLKDMAGRYISMQQITCQLCRQELYTLDQLRLHLFSSVHRGNVENFEQGSLVL